MDHITPFCIVCDPSNSFIQKSIMMNNGNETEFDCKYHGGKVKYDSRCLICPDCYKPLTQVSENVGFDDNPKYELYYRCEEHGTVATESY